jgi:hypothetical protein
MGISIQTKNRCILLLSLLLFGLCLTAPPNSLAGPYDGCNSTNASATAACSATNTAALIQAIVAYQAAVASNSIAYQGTINSDAVALALAQKVCDNTYWAQVGNPTNIFDTGLCGIASSNSIAGAWTDYYNALAQCAATNTTNLTASNQCVCAAAPARDYTIALAGVQLTRCKADALNADDQCYAIASAAQAKNDSQALATQNQGNGMASAVETSAVDIANNVAALCNYAAAVNYDICTLQVDMTINTNNICPDGCKITLDKDSLSAYTAECSVWTPGFAAYDASQTSCPTTQNYNDAVANLNMQYLESMADATYWFNNNGAQNTYNYTTGLDAAAEAKTAANCACTSTNNTIYYNCVNRALATQADADAKALAALVSANGDGGGFNLGTNWNTWNTTYLNAQATNAAVIAQDAIQANTCYSQASNTWYFVQLGATTTFNNAMIIANRKYTNCLAGCNRGG